MVMPGCIAELPGGLGAACLAGDCSFDRVFFAAAFLAGLFAAAFFFGGDFFAAGFPGIVMPGMFICAAAGVANNTLAPNKNESGFRANSLKRSTLDPSAEGAVDHMSLAAAVLAGARVAAAPRAARAATVLFGLPVLAVRHFSSPFLLCSKRANHPIASVPWYRVKHFRR